MLLSKGLEETILVGHYSLQEFIRVLLYGSKVIYDKLEENSFPVFHYILPIFNIVYICREEITKLVSLSITFIASRNFRFPKNCGLLLYLLK